MDPQQFANTIERYIESPVEGEQQDNIFVELQNATQNPKVHVQTGVDEVDLVDGQSPWFLDTQGKGRPPGKNVAATAKRGQVGKGVVQQYESRSIPLKSKGRPTLLRNKKPTNTPARRQKKQQSSSSASSDSESTCETIGNRLNPKYEYVMK